MKDLKTCIKGFWGLSRSAFGRSLLSFVLGLMNIAASLSFVWICKVLVDVATGDSDYKFSTCVGIMLALLAVRLVCSIVGGYWKGLNVVKTQIVMRRGVFSHVLRSQWNGRESFLSGDMLNRLEEDIRVLVDLACVRLPELLVTVCQLIAASVFLLSMDVSLLWLLLALMVIAALGSCLFFNKLREMTSRIRAKDSEIQQHMQENLLNRVLVLTLIGVEKVVGGLASLQKQLYGETKRRLNYGAIARSFMNFGFMAGYALAFLWGVTGIKNGAVTFGMMTALLQLVGQVQRPVASIVKNTPSLIHALTSVERLLDLTELPLEETGEPCRFQNVPDIVVSNLTFAYPDQPEPVFSNFSCQFPAGSMTVLMGPTGGGKSTLVRLILGLLKPNEGEVRIGNVKTSPLTRCNFMYVPQGNSLLSGTIRDNLLLAKADASDEQLREVLHLAAADFVFDLPLALDTPCSEVGAGLSSGQAQRIAIARALLHEGNVIILDESTSALDKETEHQLLENLYAHYHGQKTIIFVSHREMVMDYADAVLTIN